MTTKPRAILAGTFDPVTNGHLDVLERGLSFFGEILVGIAASEHKTPLFSLEERVEMFEESISGREDVRVVPFRGLLVDLGREHGINVAIRGLRMVADFEFEYQMALMNRKLDKGFDTIFLMPSAEYVFVNSTLIKEIARFGGSLDGLVPAGVRARLEARFRERTKG